MQMIKKIWTFICRYVNITSKFIEDRPESVKLVVILFGAFYVLFLYFDAIHEGKIKRTIDYTNQFESGSVLEVRSEIDSFWMTDGNRQFLEALNNDVKYQELFEYAKIKLNEDKTLRKRIFQLLDFYGSVTNCTLIGQYDVETTCLLFGDRMRNFRVMYSEYFKEVSELFQSDLLQPLREIDDVCVDGGFLKDW